MKDNARIEIIEKGILQCNEPQFSCGVFCSPVKGSTVS